MIYDHKDSRLIIFGGWSNDWFGDLWSLNVSQIVGPPYAITDIYPNKGPLTGNTKVKVGGVGFEDVNNIKLVFHCGPGAKNSMEVTAEYVSMTEAIAHTPNFTNFGAKEAEIRIEMKGNDPSVTSVFFNY